MLSFISPNVQFWKIILVVELQCCKVQGLGFVCTGVYWQLSASILNLYTWEFEDALLVTVQAMTRVKPFICTMPLKLEEGWNNVPLNLADLTRRAYGTNYVETLRVQVHANCCLRRIYFSDRLYSEEELPPEFKLYLPLQQVLSPSLFL